MSVLQKRSAAMAKVTSGEAKERLREQVLELGFDVARFSDLQPVSGKRLREWLESGYHADMDWFARSIEKRLNPNLVLDGACSVLMLGVNYLPEKGSVEATQTGFAKYSLYRDYHDTLLSGVKQVGELFENELGLGSRDYRYYVDTGPVMERGWAASAGLGWQGKNGMLISREHGNWLLLASVLVNVEIEPDEPLRKGSAKRSSHPLVNELAGDDRGRDLGNRGVSPETPKQMEEEQGSLGLLCGKCTRCIDACPTGAIVEPGIVDARKCISYQTIENKGWVPRELRSRFGGRVFGCDVCLDVCPWNRFAEAGRRQLLEARYRIAELGLIDLLAMDVETFREVFRKMPQKRTKLRGLKRNACIAAGNLRRCGDWWPQGVEGDSESGERFIEMVGVQLVKLAQEDEEALVRGHAVWAVYQLFGGKAESMLLDAKQSETDPRVLSEYIAISGH